MRPLEILTPIVLAIYLAWPLSGRKRPPAVGILPSFAVIILSTHFNVEGARWQMIPLYIFTIVIFLMSVPALLRAAKSDGPAREGTPRIILSLSLLAVATALPILLPVPNIPNPNGPYEVGTRIYELIDPARKELYSGEDEARRFMIQVWYPAEADASNTHAPWMEDANVYAPIISEYLDLPSFFLNHLTLIKTPAYKEVPVSEADKSFPIILFSHGWNGFNAQNTGQALQLASHGYVVVGVQHPYGAIVTVFPDGTIARNNPSALPKGVSNSKGEKTARKLVDQWARDLAFALDFLEAQNNNPDSPFFNRLDTSLVGVYGHSTGGGAAIQFCGTDKRCKAVLGQDPFMRPVSKEVIENGVSQPSFFMFSQAWVDETDSRNNQLFNPFYENSTDTYGKVFIEGTKHYDFTDLPLLSPLAPQLGLKGPINGKRVTTIINDYLLSFFDSVLKGEPQTLFEKPSPYEEINPKQ
jgi:predicted dienelactone hydrolase